MQQTGRSHSPVACRNRGFAAGGHVAAAATATTGLSGILELQRTAGNRAVTVAIGGVAQREMAGDGADPRFRTQRLREAISLQVFPLPQWTVNVATAREALSGLSVEDARRVKDEYQRQEGHNLAWIISGNEEVNGVPVANNLSRADRVEILNLLHGTVMSPRDAVSPAEAARVASSRWNALAGRFKAALDRQKADEAIELIPNTAAERKLLEDAYVRAFGGQIQVAMMTSLGTEAPRAVATWLGNTVVADQLALSSAAEAREKADKETDRMAKAGALMMGNTEDLQRGVARRKREAGEKLEAKVRRVREREGGEAHLKAVLGGTAGLADRVGVGSDRVVTAIAAGDVGGEQGAALARKDREGDVPLAEAEGVIRHLRDVADAAVEAEIARDPANEGRRDEISRRINGQYWAAFERGYGGAGPRRPLRDLVSGTGGDRQRTLQVFGIDAGAARTAIQEGDDSVRNRALLDAKGDLPPWRELYLALNRETRDMDRVRAILDPLTRSQVDELSLQYRMHTAGHSLERDLAGTPLEQEATRWFGDGKERERQREGAVLLRGGRFDAASAEASLPRDLAGAAREAALAQAEGRFLFGRIADLERRVTENRGAFAYARDWAGNEERELLDLARRDGTDAKSALEEALLRHDDAGNPDLAEARRQLHELRRVQYRLEHATSAYKESTQRAFDAFVDGAVNVASFVAGLFPGGVVLTMLRTTAATIGTKLLLKGNEYSAEEFVADVEAGLASGVGDMAKLPLKDLSTWTAKKFAEETVRLGIEKSFRVKVAKVLGEAAMRQADHTVSTAAQNAVQGKSLGEGQGLGDRAMGELKHHLGNAAKEVAGIQDAPATPEAPATTGSKTGGGEEEPAAKAGPAGDEEPAAKAGPGGEEEPAPTSGPGAAGAARTAGGDGVDIQPRAAGETKPMTTVATGDDAGDGADGGARVSMHLPEESPRMAATPADSQEAARRPQRSPGRDADEIPFHPPAAFDVAAHQQLETPRALEDAQISPSRPRHTIFKRYRRARFQRTTEAPKEGQSEQHVVVDTVTHKKYLFKPTTGELEVDRAAERGIDVGDLAGRAKAAELAAARLGIATPRVKLAMVDGRPGSLTEWWDGYTSLGAINKDNPGRAQQILRDPEFKRQLNRIDALDYLTNNLDRGGNFGNYMVKLRSDGSVETVIPIDHDLTFTATKARALIENRTRGLPHAYEPEMVAKLEAIAADREAFTRQLEPLVGKEAIPGVLARLDELLVDARNGGAKGRRRR